MGRVRGWQCRLTKRTQLPNAQIRSGQGRKKKGCVRVKSLDSSIAKVAIAFLVCTLIYFIPFAFYAEESLAPPFLPSFSPTSCFNDPAAYLLGYGWVIQIMIVRVVGIRCCRVHRGIRKQKRADTGRNWNGRDRKVSPEGSLAAARTPAPKGPVPIVPLARLFFFFLRWPSLYKQKSPGVPRHCSPLQRYTPLVSLMPSNLSCLHSGWLAVFVAKAPPRPRLAMPPSHRHPGPQP